MAQALANTDEDDDSPPTPSMKSALITCLMAIVIGGGSGFGLGYFKGQPAPAAAAIDEPAAAGAEPGSAEFPAKKSAAENPGKSNVETEAEKATDQDGEKMQTHVTLIDPIVTNLSDPADIWIRLELVITSDMPLEGDLTSQIHQDLFAHVRAMRLAEMAGPSAFIDLKAELLARARQRSNGLVRSIYVKTLVYE
jgi:flagellar protein FliL